MFKINVSKPLTQASLFRHSRCLIVFIIIIIIIIISNNNFNFFYHSIGSLSLFYYYFIIKLLRREIWKSKIFVFACCSYIYTNTHKQIDDYSIWNQCYQFNSYADSETCCCCCLGLSLIHLCRNVLLVI